MKHILILLAGFLILVFSGCYNFNNPVDPDSDNYQGYPSDQTPPAAPSDLIATIENPYIHLEWTDNSNNEDGFRIERKIGNGDYSEIYTVESNVTTYNDHDIDLATGTEYTYRVRAYNSFGYSDYSNEASPTP